MRTAANHRKLLVRGLVGSQERKREQPCSCLGQGFSEQTSRRKRPLTPPVGLSWKVVPAGRRWEPCHSEEDQGTAGHRSGTGWQHGGQVLGDDWVTEEADGNAPRHS
ncbi:hypothetical protein MRX96_028454 [Rhipicephalus microplus]